MVDTLVDFQLQDFVFELLKREQDFVSEYQYLPKKLKKRYVPIGGSDAGGDTWLIKSTDNNDHQIYELWHQGDGELTLLDLTFERLIERNIDELIELYPTKIFNKDKRWCVQFSIDTTDEDLLLKTIKAIRTKEWVLKEITTAGVYCYNTEIEIASEHLEFRRSEYKEWKTPAYYFDYREPLPNMGNMSIIKRIDTLLKDQFKGYKLIEYGIL